MLYRQFFIKAVADILLVGDWHLRAIRERVYWLLQSEPIWVVPLVDEIYVKFKADFPYVTEKQVSDFIANNQKFVKNWR